MLWLLPVIDVELGGGAGSGSSLLFRLRLLPGDIHNDDDDKEEEDEN